MSLTKRSSRCIMKSYKPLYYYIIVTVFSLTISSGYAQETSVKGKVIDAENGEPIPFVSVGFKGTTIGTATDFEGYFHIKTNQLVDSIVVSYVGYKTKSKLVTKGIDQVINFQLLSSSYNLSEVVVSSGENPAYAIIRNAIQRKKNHNWKKLNAYAYESYTKVEIDVDNISEHFKKRKFMKKISQVVDSIQRIAGEDGKPVLPIFVSEAISMCYFRRTPDLRKEKVMKTQVTGVGVQDESFVSQLIGTSFKEYNFYQNWLTILGKDFISPLAEGWKMSYEYYLEDSMYVGEDWCYQIEVQPKRSSDLAFVGTIWITKNDFALKQVDLGITSNANINYIEKIRVHQELASLSGEAWFPIKTRVLIDIAELTNKSAGMLAKFYVSNKDFVVNQPHPVSFYNPPVEVKEDANLEEPGYWSSHRHDSLTSTEKHVYTMIDSLKKVPIVKTYIDIVDLAVNGYKKVGGLDIGPYLFVYAHNRLEGHRFRLGFRTNTSFSKKWIFKGYAAYGMRDREWKYSAESHYIISRLPWTIIGIKYRHDLEQVGLLTEDIENNNLFLAFSKWGPIDRRLPFFLTEGEVFFQTDVAKGLTQKISLRQRYFNPLYDFSYYKKLDVDTVIGSNFGTSEVRCEMQYSKDQLFIQKGNVRKKLGTSKSPVFTLQYTWGIKNSWGGDFDYHKFLFSINHTINLGHLGRSSYVWTMGYIPSRLPYQLLYVPLGNQTIFYNSSSFNLMRYFEFVTDTYVAFHYVHHFEGLLFNRFPLVKKWKWRLVATADAVYGTLQNQNQSIIPDKVNNRNEFTTLKTFSTGIPYVEVGYGIENIFKFLRVSAVHRLTYLDSPHAKKFGVMVSAQFRL